MEKSQTYQCMFCGEKHEKDHLCLNLLNKLNSYTSKNFLFGNIFLECRKQNINFIDLYREVCYLAELGRDHADFNCLNAEFVIDYFASVLNCNPKIFFKPPQDTMHELFKLGSVDFLEVSEDEEGNIESIDFSFCDAYSSITSTSKQYHVFVSKTKDFLDNWVYRVYIDKNILIRGPFEDRVAYGCLQMNDYGYSFIMLGEEYTGDFAEAVERKIDDSWIEILTESKDTKDPLFAFWLNTILYATQNNKLLWTGSRNYHTKYRNHNVFLHIHRTDSTDDTTHVFAIRINREKAIKFAVGLNTIEESKLLKLADSIQTSYIYQKSLMNQSGTTDKKIRASDVLVVYSSMYCRKLEHELRPYRGIVPLATKNGVVEEYVIYVGYCTECNTYTIFKADYLKMLEYGTPLCRVHNYNDKKNINGFSEFNYKSQSVLASYGYTVQANSPLSESDRQQLLVDCINDGALAIHEILDFLHWLVRTRESQSKYQNAITKWKKDIEFVKKYEEEKRLTVRVSSIIIK